MQIESKDALVLTDDIAGSSGFAVNGRLVTWALDHVCDVANASLQAAKPRTYTVRGRDLDIYPCQNNPKTSGQGKQQMQQLLAQTEPKFVVSLIDPQMDEYLIDLKKPRRGQIRLRKAGERINAESVVGQVQQYINAHNGSQKFDFISQIPVDANPAPNSWDSYLNGVDYPIAMSDFGQERLAVDHDVDVPVIKHGVDMESVHDIDAKKFRIGAVNKNQHRKRYPRLIKACGKFYKKANRPDDVEFYFHTNPNDSMGWPLNKYARQWDIAEATKPYEGQVSRKRLTELYNSFDVFVSATAGEGFGLTTIEAMSQETPVIITDCTTSPELVIEGNPSPRGTCIDPATWYYQHPELTEGRRALVDTDAFAETLVEYYNDRERCQKEGKNAHNWVTDTLSWNAITEQWKDYFANTVMD